MIPTLCTPSEYVMGPMVGPITLLNRPKIADSSRPITKQSARMSARISKQVSTDEEYQEKLKFVKSQFAKSYNAKFLSDKNAHHSSKMSTASLKKGSKKSSVSSNTAGSSIDSPAGSSIDSPAGSSIDSPAGSANVVDSLNLETENLLSMQRLMFIKSTQSIFGSKGAQIANTLRSSFMQDIDLFFRMVSELQKYCKEFSSPVHKNVTVGSKSNLDLLISSPEVDKLATGLSSMDVLEIFLKEPTESIQTFNMWYYSQFRHLLWCANAAALSMGPRLLQREIIDSGSRGFRLQTLQFANDLAAHCDVAIAKYLMADRISRMEMLVNIAVSALAIHESACLIATKDVFSKLSQIAATAESSTANSLVTVVPMLIPNIQNGIRFISDELAGIKQMIIDDDPLALADANRYTYLPGRGDKKC